MAEKTVPTTGNQMANQPSQAKERTRGPERAAVRRPLSPPLPAGGAGGVAA